MRWNWVGRWQCVPGMQVAILWALINNGVAVTTVPGPAEELEDGQFVLLRKNEDDNYVTCSAKHAARKQRRSRKQSMVSWEKGSLCQCVCGYVWEECCGDVWEECLRVWWEECVCMCVCSHMCVCMCLSMCVCWEECNCMCAYICWEDCVCVCPHVGVGKTVFQCKCVCMCEYVGKSVCISVQV